MDDLISRPLFRGRRTDRHLIDVGIATVATFNSVETRVVRNAISARFADGESDATDATAVSSAIAFSLVETKSGRNHLPLSVGLFGDWEKVLVE